MSYGEGSIREKKRPDGKSYNPKRWQVCVSYMVDVIDDDGNTKSERKRIQRTVRGTKAEAKAVRDEIIATHDDQGNELDSYQVAINECETEQLEATTLTDMIEVWNKARKTAGKASERTISEDRKRLERVEEYLGSKPLDSITAKMVEETYAALREKYGLSGTTLNHIHTLLKNVFQKAVDYDLVHKNPCRFVDTPKRDDPDRRSLSQEEGAKLLQKVDEAEAAEYSAMDEKEQRREVREERGYARNRKALRGMHLLSNIMVVRIGLATGMRRGEVIGLIWKNVDLTRKTIRVCQSATIAGGVKKPKTQAGIRTLAIDDATVQHLSYWKARQAAELAKISKSQSPETPVCCTDAGTMLRVDNFEHWWSTWRDKNGFPGLKFHELRHTQATMLLANGVDVKTVQTRLGHANPSITLGWYAHAIPENDHDAAQMLGNMFNASTQAELENERESEAMSSKMSSASDPEAKDSSMSSKCLPKQQHSLEKQTGQLLKFAS